MLIIGIDEDGLDGIATLGHILAALAADVH